MARGNGKKKFVFVVIDGVADRPCKELENKTPLEISFKPFLDWFAANGRSGTLNPPRKGEAPESDSAIMALIGYDPEKYFTGRGPLEAFGAGLPFRRGDLALRANFGTLKNGKLVDRRVGRTLTNSEAKILAQAINQKVRLGFPFIFKPTVEHRGVLAVHGSFSDNITNTDPGYAKKGKFAVAISGKNSLLLSKPLDEDEVTHLSANIVNNFVDQSAKVLKNHPLNISREANGLLPANVILLRDAGTELPELPKKKEKWLAFSEMPLELAMTKLSGMEVIRFPYPDMISANTYKNLYFSLKSYLDFVKRNMEEKWDRYECFYIHIKETDIPGHDGLPIHKKKMIEMIDEVLFSYLRKKNISLCVTSDHSTPSILRRHSADPVPFLIYGKGKDGVRKFDEKSCAKGSFGKHLGKELLNLAL